MRGVFTRLVWIAPLAGCGIIGNFGGQELEDDVYEDQFGAEVDADPQDEGAPMWVPVGEAACDDTVDAEALDATGGAGEVGVVHAGVEGPCEADWDVSAAESEGVVTLTYVDLAGASTTVCGCAWTFDYTLQNAPSGEWTIAAGTLETDVTVTAP